ncbi:hypothetical protein GCK72_000107 [Caenorhabditis remanei]|uniref:Uncharacterized protein n=1 Tax=Caenorhabditis remanei TaxID=31234 RepID=A0A6A5HL78_CAERE|nr:hypothetical protein GCK72_000107 [Caenorhabditis remanei]KAF1768295.1 hypothetical protein GCK72_000107 [Caenorhabditis remanei]
MIQKPLSDVLNAPRRQEQLRQLVALAADVPLKDVGIYFSWKDFEPTRQKEFEEEVAEGLTTFFKVPTDAKDIEGITQFWQIINILTCYNPNK